MGRLDGRVAVVTGGSRGIGRAICLALAREGADVCVNYNASRDGALGVVREIAAMGRRAVAVQGDVGVADDARAVVERAIEEFGELHILVNNAGILLRGSFTSIDAGELERMERINVGGVIHCTEAAAKHMKEKRYGKIINIASIAGIGTAVEGTTPYAMTKAAVIILTKRYAFELGRYNINVNCIAPGYVLTDMTAAGRSREEVEELIRVASQKSVLGRIGRPEDIAGVAVFLASDEASYMTGQTLVVDGGRIDFLTHSL